MEALSLKEIEYLRDRIIGFLDLDWPEGGTKNTAQACDELATFKSYFGFFASDSYGFGADEVIEGYASQWCQVLRLSSIEYKTILEQLLPCDKSLKRLSANVLSYTLHATNIDLELEYDLKIFLPLFLALFSGLAFGLRNVD